MGGVGCLQPRQPGHFLLTIFPGRKGSHGFLCLVQRTGHLGTGIYQLWDMLLPGGPTLYTKQQNDERKKSSLVGDR